jgi:hypothetical protein
LWRGTERPKEKGRRKKSFFLMGFLGFEVCCSLESEFEFAAEFIAVGKIELVIKRVSPTHSHIFGDFGFNGREIKSEV